MENLPRWKASARLALATVLFAAAIETLGGSVSAAAQDWKQQLPGFDGFRKNTRLTQQEQRDRRLQIRDQFGPRFAAEFETTAPLMSHYMIASLQRAVDRYRALVARGGWPTLPDGTIREGDQGESVTLLRNRLQMTGDLKQDTRQPWEFDAALTEAIVRFQVRHGLRITGFVDSRTLRALNVPATTRQHQLEVNLARLHGLAEKAGEERFVMVNVPSYQLEAVENGRLVMRSNAVVGKPQRATPTVSANIIELNFYPYWRVPVSIASRDLIPQIRKDPSYFDREHFSVMKAWGTEPLNVSLIDWNSPEVFNYKFRQDPGPWNALGAVRINMPNEHIVYLHDTPLKQLFGEEARAFSSGCVRVERVLDVVAWLLKDEKDWSAERVHQAVNEGVPLDVKLKKRVPVHFVYVTAWATEQGEAVFRPDIYRRDGAADVLAAEDLEAPKDTSITP